MQVTFELDIKADLSAIRRQLRSLSSDILPKAAATALNKTAVNVRTEASRSISKQTGMKVGAVKKRIIIKRARRMALIADVIGRKYAPNLINYVRKSQANTRSFRRKKGRGKNRAFAHEGVIARAWNKRKVYDGSFIGRSKAGKLLVFAREGDERKPIKPVYGPSLPRTFIKKETEKVMRAVAQRRWVINIEREVRFRLSKLR